MDKPLFPPRLLLLYFAGFGSWWIGNLAVRVCLEQDWLPRGAVIALAIACVLPLVVAPFVFLRIVREDLDELLQKVLLEGFAFALVVSLPVIAIYVNLASAGVYVPKLDAPDFALLPLAGTAAGVMLAWRRYAA